VDRFVALGTRVSSEKGDENVALKIAMIGAGSIGFTRTLMHDIVAVPELADTTFAFTDISSRNLDMVTQLCQRDLEANKLPAKIVATEDRRKAIAESDYVISTIRQGGLEAFQTDIDIPLKYGVDQCVGDKSARVESCMRSGQSPLCSTFAKIFAKLPGLERSFSIIPTRWR